LFPGETNPLAGNFLFYIKQTVPCQIIRDLNEAASRAVEIPERNLIVAADEPGVRMQRGQWWLPV
jgi:hypothetical protein